MDDSADFAVVSLDFAHVRTQEQLLSLDLTALRAALRDISAFEEPDQWAAGHLVLGAALRLRARRMAEHARGQTYDEAIRAFQRAVEVYCQRKPLTMEWHDGVLRRQPGARQGGSAQGVDGVDLVLQATRSPLRGDMELLGSAVRLFREDSSWRVREADFQLWLLNLNNYGCALTLLGRCRGGEAGITELEEAVDAFRSVLKEPALAEIPSQQASIYVNLAGTLHTLAQLAMPGERQRYLESAVDSLSRALEVVAPARYRALITRSQ